MATVKVSAPAGESVNGLVAGVEFTKGVAQVDRHDAAAMSYFRRHGYLIDGETRTAPDAPVDARDASVPAQVGSPLRDAAVNPRPGDFLPPTNAGQADPHGPDVVSPGLHGVEGVRPVTPGYVPPADPQEDKETAAAVQATSGEPVAPVVAIPRPARSAPVGVWREYAAAQPGADPAAVAGMTKATLVDRFGDG